MTNSKRAIGSVTLLAVISFLSCAISALAQTSIRVKVFESSDSNGTTYSYRVANETTQRIVGLRIGFDYLHGEAELRTPPIGWTLREGLSPSSTTSPHGWTARLVTTEENSRFDIEWSSDEGPQFDIAPGATVSGFSVRLPRATPEYRTAHFDVILGNSTHKYGLLEPDTEGPSDVTPPILSVSLSPSEIWPPSHKVVPITATIRVSDDLDPHPTVQLVSITCNEVIDPAIDISDASYGTDDRVFGVRAERTGQRKDGRVYTITYMAKDAAGNQARATATVRIPHDQRKK